MLLPKRVKHRKVMRGRMKGKATRGNVVSNGEYGLQALEPSWITSRQIEALANLAHGREVNKAKKPDQKEYNPYFDYVTSALHKKFKTKVKIKDNEIRISFKDEATLKRIMELL